MQTTSSLALLNAPDEDLTHPKQKCSAECPKRGNNWTPVLPPSPYIVNRLNQEKIMDTYDHLTNPITARNRRIQRNRILEVIGWVIVACLLMGGAYIGIKKQDAIFQERNV